MKNDQIDELDEKILRLIGDNARIPFLEVARECNVSGAAIHQRITKLIETGVIQGSKFLFDWDKVGYETCAFIGARVIPGSVTFDELIDSLKLIPEITECYFSTGKYDLMFKIVARNNKHLLSIVQKKVSVLGFSELDTIVLYEEAFRRQIPIGQDSEEY